MEQKLCRQDGTNASVGDVIVGVDGKAREDYPTDDIKVILCNRSHNFDIISKEDWEGSLLRKRLENNAARMKSPENQASTAARMKSPENQASTAARMKSPELLQE